MTDHEDLMAIQVETLFSHDENGRLQSTNEPAGEKQSAPRFFLGRIPEGAICRFRFDLPATIVKQLQEIVAEEPKKVELQTYLPDIDRFRGVLEAHAPVQEVWIGPAYRFPDNINPHAPIVQITRDNSEPLQGDLSGWCSGLDRAQPCVAVVADGRAVSVCGSLRISANAYEAGIDTLAPYRRRGYATAAAAGWALAVRALGLIPLYSTSADNLASQRVAQKLGLVQYGVDLTSPDGNVHISREQKLEYARRYCCESEVSRNRRSCTPL